MRTFITKHQKTDLKITFKYDLNGVLRIMEFDGNWTPETVQKIIQKIPTQLDKILSEIKNQKPESNWIFAELTEVSFKAFCGRYPRKDGGIAVAEKAWNKLNEADQMEAILYIPVLINEKNDGTAFPYRATYLNQKRWR